AAAAATWGVAQDVPPQVRPVIETLVGAEMSGFRRPSSVGPWDEYASGAKLAASKAPTENEPRASPGVGTLEAAWRIPSGSAKRQNSVRWSTAGEPTRAMRR